MEATVMLADWAEAINGKLYIQGGGWSRISAATPLNCALAVKLVVGWDEANVQHRVVVRLLDQDDQPVEPQPGHPVMIERLVEVGRPAGIVRGSDLDAAFAVQLLGVVLPPGRYRFVVEVGGEPLGRGVPFDVV